MMTTKEAVEGVKKLCVMDSLGTGDIERITHLIKVAEKGMDHRKIRELYEHHRRLEWIMANEPNDTDKKIRARSRGFATALQRYLGVKED